MILSVCHQLDLGSVYRGRGGCIHSVYFNPELVTGADMNATHIFHSDVD